MGSTSTSTSGTVSFISAQVTAINIIGSTYNLFVSNATSSPYHLSVGDVAQVSIPTYYTGLVTITASTATSVGFTFTGSYALTSIGENGTIYKVDSTTDAYTMSGGVFTSKTITDANGDIEKLTYDSRGRVSSDTSPNGGGVAGVYTTNYSYNYAGQVTQTEQAGTTQQFAYDGMGNLTQTVDGNSHTTTYTYDLLGEMLTMTTPPVAGAPSGLVTKYAYYDGVKTQTIDPAGNTTTYAYDLDHRLTETTLPDGSSTQTTYDAIGNIASQTDPNGNVTTYFYDSRDRLIETLAPDGGLTLVSFDGGGRVIDTAVAFMVANATVSSYGPDNFENTESTFNTGDEPLTTTDALGNTTEFNYNTHGDLLSTTDARGVQTVDTFDILGREVTSETLDAPVSVTGFTVSGSTATIVAANNGYQAGEVIELTMPGYLSDAVVTITTASTNAFTIAAGVLTGSAAVNGGTASRREELTGYSYDSNGNMISVVDFSNLTGSAGNTTIYAYDAFNRKTQMISPAPTTGGSPLTTTYSYDKANNLTMVVDPLSHTTLYAYDADNRKTQEIDPAPGGTATQPTTIYAYDANGNLTSVTDPRVNTTTYVYDSRNREIKEITPPSNGGSTPNTTVYTYDANGNKLTMVDPNGNTTSYAYDNENRMTQEIGASPDGVSPGPTSTFVYETVGVVFYSVDPLGNTTTYEYDADNQLVLDIEPGSNGTIGYVYDSVGNTTAVQNEDGYVTTYAYDALNRKTEMVQPAPGGTTTWAYDALGNLTATTDANGNTTTYAYDNLNRQTQMIAPSPTGSGSGPTTLYAYDADNNLTMVTDPNGNATTYTYDGLNRKIVETEPVPGSTGAHPSITYAYDADGNVTMVTDANGHSTIYTYDADNELLTTTNALGGVQSATYDGDGNTITTTDPNGEITVNTYDSLNRVILTRTLDPAKTVTAISVTGSVATVTASNNGYSVGDFIEISVPGYFTGDVFVTSIIDTNHFTFAAGSLTGSTTNTGTANRRISATAYQYDLDNNVTASIPYAVLDGSVGQTTSFAYDAMNRKTQEIDPAPTGSGAAPTTLYAYDAVGNMTQTIDPNGNTTQYIYDGLNHKALEVQDSDDGVEPYIVTAYFYDKDGNMTASIAPADASYASGVYTIVSGEAHTTLYNYDGLNRLTSEVAPSPDGVSPGSTTSYTYDANGNQLTMVDPNGNTTTYAYDHLNRKTMEIDPDPDGAGPLTSPTTTYAYDSAGNLTQEIDPLGNQTDYVYNALNQEIEESQPAITQPDPVQNSDFTFSGGGSYVNINSTNTPGWIPSSDSGNSPWTAIASDPQPPGFAPGTFSTYMQVQTTAYVSGPQDVYQQITISASGTYTLSAVAEVRTDGVNTDGTIILNLWSGALTGFSSGSPITPDSSVTPTLNATYQTFSNTYVLAAGTYTIQVGGESNTSNMFQAAVDGISLNGTGSPITYFAYDADGNQTLVTDAAGNTTTYTYDGLNRELTNTNQTGYAQTNKYDALGNLVQYTDRDGRTTTYQYDDDNRQTQELWIGSGGTPINTISYTYDIGGRETSSFDSTSTTTYTYDNLNRQTSESDTRAGLPVGDTLAIYNAYDARGNLIEQIVQAGSYEGVPIFDSVNLYSYDGQNRLESEAQISFATAVANNYASDSGEYFGLPVDSKEASFGYDADSNLTGMSTYNLDTDTQIDASSYGYDADNRLTSMDNAIQTSPSVTNRSYTFAYDAASQLTQETSYDGTSAYGYDADNRLTLSTQGSVTQNYSYDLNGNRTSTDGTSDTTGDNNELTSDGTFSYAYDNEGNLTEQDALNGSEFISYAYDYRDRLTSVTYEDSSHTATQTVAYAYDANNRRISTTVNVGGTTTVNEQYLYDGSDLLATVNVADPVDEFVPFYDDGSYYFSLEISSGLTSERDFNAPAGAAVSGNDQVLAQENAATGETSWELTDNQGSVVDVVDNATGGHAVVLDDIVYDSYGNIQSQSNAANDVRQGFTGYLQDAATGLDYANARWYQPLTGSFISVDPAGFASGTYNLYGYVNQAPTNGTDPSGMVADIGSNVLFYGLGSPVLSNDQTTIAPPFDSTLPGNDSGTGATSYSAGPGSNLSSLAGLLGGPLGNASNAIPTVPITGPTSGYSQQQGNDLSGETTNVIAGGSPDSAALALSDPLDATPEQLAALDGDAGPTSGWGPGSTAWAAGYADTGYSGLPLAGFDLQSILQPMQPQPLFDKETEDRLEAMMAPGPLPLPDEDWFDQFADVVGEGVNLQMYALEHPLSAAGTDINVIQDYIHGDTSQANYDANAFVQSADNGYSAGSNEYMDGGYQLGKGVANVGIGVYKTGKEVGAEALDTVNDVTYLSTGYEFYNGDFSDLATASMDPNFSYTQHVAETGANVVTFGTYGEVKTLYQLGTGQISIDDASQQLGAAGVGQLFSAKVMSVMAANGGPEPTEAQNISSIPLATEGSPYLPSGEASPLLDQIRAAGGTLPVDGPDIPLQDLALASRAAGNEIAVYQDLATGQHFVTEGDPTEVKIPLNSNLVLHVQPGEGPMAVLPSAQDRVALQMLNQQSSLIIDSGGTYQIQFGATNAADGPIEPIK